METITTSAYNIFELEIFKWYHFAFILQFYIVKVINYYSDVFYFTVLLIWNMLLDNKYEDISNYEIFCYCESQIPFPYSNAWLKLKKVTALPLPMACTIQQVIIEFILFKK